MVLNTLTLTLKKQRLLDGVSKEYLRVLNETLKMLPNARSGLQLHQLTYLGIRENSFLPADVVEEARKDVWAERKTVKDGFKYCSVRFNSTLFRFVVTKRGNPCVRLTFSPHKTVVIPLKLDGSFERFNSFIEEGYQSNCVSLLQNGGVAVSLRKPFVRLEDRRRFVVGVEVGSASLAAVTVLDAEKGRVKKQLYFGRDIAARQHQFFERRRKLQSYADTGSGKARKYLRKLKRKQRNYVNNRSGEVSKQIVVLAESYGASVSIEKLRVQERRHEFNWKSNRKINLIPYGKLRDFLVSNCGDYKVPLRVVDAYHTSKWCPHCGAVNKGHHPSNYSLYRCKACGLAVNSDRKASVAIAVKSVLERKTQDFTTPVFFQISSIRVPVNGLVRPSEGQPRSPAEHIGHLTESLSTC